MARPAGAENVRLRFEDALLYCRQIGRADKRPPDIVDSSESNRGGGLLARATGATLDDGSFVVRITFDACTVHLRGDGITRDVMLGLLTQADVGHVGVFGTDDCPPLASCVPPGTTEPPVETVPPVATVPRP